MDSNLQATIENNHNLTADQIIVIITSEKNEDLNQVYALEISDKIKASNQ